MLMGESFGHCCRGSVAREGGDDTIRVLPAQHLPGGVWSSMVVTLCTVDDGFTAHWPYIAQQRLNGGVSLSSYKGFFLTKLQ